MISEKEIHALEQAFKELCDVEQSCEACPLSMTYHLKEDERLIICNAEYVLGRIAVFNAIERDLIV